MIATGVKPILIVDGWRFYCTSDSEGSIKKTMWGICTHSTLGLSDVRIKGFGVNISTVNPRSREVTKWNKEEGYSLWYKSPLVCPFCGEERDDNWQNH